MASELTTIPLTEPITLQVRLGRGRVEIDMREDVSTATVTLTPRSSAGGLLERMTVELRGRELIVAGPRQVGLPVVRGWLARAVDTRIEVPAGTQLSIASANDDILVTGRSGTADIATAAARITLGAVDGDLRVRNSHAEVRVASVSGRVRLQSGSGSATLGDVGGALDLQLGRGDVVVAEAAGAVRVRNGYGAVHLRSASADIDVATGYGAIEIGVPTGISAQVDAQTGMGEVISPAPVEHRPAPGATKISVRARTGMGTITFNRVDAAAA